MTESEAIKNINTYIYSELESIPKQFLESLKLACFTLREVQQYRAIGTPEECRAAVEKQKAKKPDCIEDKMWCCPVCDNHLLPKWVKYPTELMPKTEGLPYCMSCGQKIDFGE